jgi:hypothetical protein
MTFGRYGNQSAAGTDRPAFDPPARFRPPPILSRGRGTAILWPWRELFPVKESVQNDIQESQDDCLVKRDNMPEQQGGGEDHPGTSPTPNLYGGSDLGEFGHLRVRIEVSVDFDRILPDRCATA